MKKFKCLLTAMFLGCSTMSFAQFMNGGGPSASSSDVDAWKGLRFSYDRTFVRYDVDGADNENGNGFTIGYEQAFKVSKKLPIFIQTGLDLNFARYKEDEGGFDSKTSHLGLSIPANFVYGVKINNVLAIKPYTGFYLRVNLMAKEKIDGYDEKINLFDKDDVGDYTWNRVQGGWQIGTTLDVNEFNVGIGYAIDFNEIAEKTKASKFMIKLGWNF